MIPIPYAPGFLRPLTASLHRAVQHLKGIGCQASGIISDSDLLEAVRAETRAHDYDQVILATSRQGGTWLARVLRRAAVHRLQPPVSRRGRAG